jgi:hypothetical protein
MSAMLGPRSFGYNPLLVITKDPQHCDGEAAPFILRVHFVLNGFDLT